MIPASPHAALDRALDNIPNIIEQVKRPLNQAASTEKNKNRMKKQKKNQLLKLFMLIKVRKNKQKQ